MPTIYKNRQSPNPVMPDTILAIGAHNDDHVIGAGGTLIKYAKEGKIVKTAIVCYGETSHPHLKPEVIVARRIKEAEEADKIMGGSGIEWLGAYDSTFDADIERLKIVDKIKSIIQTNKPSKIFTHAPDDAHPNHRSTYKAVMEAVKEFPKIEVYSFEIWHAWTLKNRDKPKLVVDVSETFKKKIAAFKAHESQATTIRTLLWRVYLRAWTAGFGNKCKYAEVFIKIQ